jgi:hypothetical protein
MDHRVIYHWWAHDSDPRQHCQNLRSPIALSIATLRAKNPEIKIDVLDCTSDFSVDRWGEWPSILDFTVYQQDPFLKKTYSHRPGYMHLSRIFDLQSIKSDEMVIYSDADVFWFLNPLPLMRDGKKVAFNGYNTGFFYYIPDQSQKFFEIFNAYTITALNNEIFRQELRKHVGYNDWYYVFDEMTMSYMFHEHTELFSKIDISEHCTIRDLSHNPSFIKMIHGNGAMMHNHLAKHAGEREHCRGLFCLIWKELWDGLNKVLDDDQIGQVFTSQELSYYLPRQYSFLENFPRASNTKQKNGSFHIHKSLSATFV